MIEGKAFIFSAPSGSGKTTIVRHLLETFSELEFSISATTRDPRGSEENGVDYYFISKEDFQRKIKDDELLEYEEVYPGRFYGTLKSELHRIWSQGKHVVFDVDVVGGARLKRKLGDKALAVFIKVKDIDTLKDRLLSRATDSEREVMKRVGKAEQEMKYEDQFDVTLVNDILEDSLAEANRLVKAHLQNVSA